MSAKQGTNTHWDMNKWNNLNNDINVTNGKEFGTLSKEQFRMREYKTKTRIVQWIGRPVSYIHIQIISIYSIHIHLYIK